MLITGPGSAPHPINSKCGHNQHNGLSHHGVGFHWLIRLLVGQQDVQDCLPARFGRGTGLCLSSTILSCFLAKCDVHPGAPVSMLRGGLKEASGRCVLREEEEQCS